MNYPKNVIIITILLTQFLFFFSQAQIYDPVNWEISSSKLSDNQVELKISVKIEKGWNIYSKDTEFPPIPTSFTFNKQADVFKLEGSIVESQKIVTKYDEIFEKEVGYYNNGMSFTQKVNILTPEPFEIILNIEYQACDDEKCLPPKIETFSIPFNGYSKEKKNEEKIDNRPDALIIPNLDLENPVDECVEKQETKKTSLSSIFILGFLGGLIALLTPCVFPMIPLTVSFFTKQSENKKKGILNATLYGFFIFTIYLLLSSPFHFLDNISPEILNNISTNIWLNFIFFLIFLFFAFSFFGYYELRLPSSWTSKTTQGENLGGVLGIFFMALTLAIVSFSCTGPILGSLLVGSLTSEGGAWQLTSGMGGFGMALALPFAVFALFPNWMKSIPKSGGWLNTVKVILGFLELALALKFLSNADLVGEWGILKREVFLGIWIVIFLALAIYCLGKIRFPHDPQKPKLGTFRVVLGIFFILFSIYLTLGIFPYKYNNLSLISGFPPPTFYSIYDTKSDCPLDLKCYKSFDEGVKQAKIENKPIMLDFTGWACVNCRRMEENVWSTKEVYKRLKNDYILISLYVDDRKVLPKEKQLDYVTNGRVKKIRTVGDLWSTFQTVNFQNNSQPHYVLLSPQGKLLTNPVGYVNKESYVHFLDCGLKAFRNLEK